MRRKSFYVWGCYDDDGFNGNVFCSDCCFSAGIGIGGGSEISNKRKPAIAGFVLLFIIAPFEAFPHLPK